MILKAPEIRENLPFFLNHFSKMSKDDIYCRFFYTVSSDGIRSWLLSFDESSQYHTWFIVEESDDGEFVGLAQISYEGDNQTKAEIAISVLPQARGKGIAFQLISTAVESLKLLGAKEATFQCNLQNHACRRVFEKAGFTGSYNSDQEVFIGTLNLEAL